MDWSVAWRGGAQGVGMASPGEWGRRTELEEVTDVILFCITLQDVLYARTLTPSLYIVSGVDGRQAVRFWDTSGGCDARGRGGDEERGDKEQKQIERKKYTAIINGCKKNQANMIIAFKKRINER